MPALWRELFSFNKYSQIASRALRQSLKESERVQAEKRGLTSVRYQNWENGKAGEQIWVNRETEKDVTKSAAV
ncbi:hypothetical protein Clacol_006526 [Clathrus columnatus]|uniref:Mitochondrial ATP synthase epsilon chain n=1 Tax=Clathrus columnatus TaxID=1419009 RepID=A0AAV5AD33_9AGAM|nr:hypothetical protein Clacol_006526 [Clathrus columnatus]